MSSTTTVPSSVPSPFLTKNFISLFIQTFCVFCSFSVLTVLPDHLANIGASKTYVGLLMNMNSLGLLLLVVPLSHFADRIGRKRLMLAGYVTALVSAVGAFIFTDSLTFLALFRIPAVLLFYVVFTIQGAEAFGLFPRERRMSGMAVFGISGMSANPVGAFIGETLLEGPGVRWLFVVSFILCVGGLLLSAAYPYQELGKNVKKSSFMDLIRRKELAPLFILAFLLGGAFAVFTSFLANMTRLRLGTVNIFLFFLCFSSIAICIRLFMASMLEGIAPRRITSVCFSMIALAFLLTFGLKDAFMLAPIGLVYGIGHSILFPLLSTLFVNAGNDEDRLGLNNIFSATNLAGGLVCAVAMGLLADQAGLPVVFLVMAILCVAMVPLGYIGLRQLLRTT